MGNKIGLVFFVLAALGACSGRSAEDQAGAMARSYAELTARYDLLNDQINEKMRNSQTPVVNETLVDEYKRIQDERKRELEALLEKNRIGHDGAALDLVRSKIMIEIGRYDAAEKIIDRLQGKKDGAGAEAKLQKVILHLVRRRYPEAAVLFRKIEPIAARDGQFFNISLALAFSHPEPAVRKEFSLKLIAAPRLPDRVQSMIPHLHANMAMLAKEANQTAQAMTHLEKALANDSAMKAIWENELRQLRLLGQPPPPLEADHWFNAQPQSLAALKGKVVLINFWAPWCGPCRRVMPALEKYALDYRDRGLLVIGYTRLYGRYGDDREKQLQVTADRELSLIRGYIDRSKISYPIAVSTEGRAFEAYAVTAIPTMVFIDRRGNIARFKTGVNTSGQIREKIEALLAEE